MLKAVRLFAGGFKRINKSTMLYVLMSAMKVAPFVVLYLIGRELFAPVTHPGTEINTVKIIWFLVALFVIQILYLVVAMKTYTESFITSYELSSETRLRLGEHLRRLSLGFFAKRDPGDITALLLQDMDKAEQMFSHLFFELVSAVVVPALIAAFLFFVDWRLGLIVVVSAAIAFPLLSISQRIIRRFMVKQVDSANRAASRMLEYLQGIKDIKAFNLAGGKFDRLRIAFDTLREDSIKMEASAGPMIISYRFVLDIGLVSLLLVGNYYLFHDSITLTVFLLFLIIGYQFFEPLQNIGAYLAELRYMSVATDRITRVMDTQPLPEPAAEKEVENHDIEFRDVSFGYGDTMVLEGVSFKAPERSMTALIGPSGSGKTTITNLIARFWDVDSGEVLVGGRNVKEIENDNLLSYLSMVFQNVYLFNDTIYNNIRIGKTNATHEEIMDAARAAHCHEFIVELPDGYETLVGEGGSTLSGGEKQRISIARAILKNAPIVLLDEATAALDPENEVHIQKAIDTLVKEKTIIIIAHRLSTIVGADRILVLEGGRIVERGNHGELVEAGGLYSRFWNEQKRAKGWKFGTGQKERRR